MMSDLSIILQDSYLEGENYVSYFFGFEMSNDCGIIADSPESEDPNEVRDARDLFFYLTADLR